MSDSGPSTTTPEPPLDDLAVCAKRIGDMLDRWQGENVSDEPEWDIEDTVSVQLRNYRRTSDANGS